MEVGRSGVKTAAESGYCCGNCLLLLLLFLLSTNRPKRPAFFSGESHPITTIINISNISLFQLQLLLGGHNSSWAGE